MSKNTNIMKDMQRLNQIKQELMSQDPDLDLLMPRIEETCDVSKRLSDYFTSAKNLIIEKRKERESNA